MGCDIHCYVEVKKDGNWKFNKELDLDRNYNLFACLADVRNCRGFAGCKTGDGFTPLSGPKDLPVDCSDKVRKESYGWSGDGHSHSYLTLSELLNKDYWENNIVTLQGIVNTEEYKYFKKNGIPQSYCEVICGKNVRVISNEEMEYNIRIGLDDGLEYYTIVKWEESYKNAVGSYFVDEILPELNKLGNPEDVRIVFWFDN